MNPDFPGERPTMGPHGVFERHTANDVLDIMANTDCTYMAALSAIAIWDGMHVPNNRRAFDSGEQDRSVKVGIYDGDNEPMFVATVV